MLKRVVNSSRIYNTVSMNFNFILSVILIIYNFHYIVCVCVVKIRLVDDEFPSYYRVFNSKTACFGPLWPPSKCRFSPVFVESSVGHCAIDFERRTESKSMYASRCGVAWKTETGTMTAASDACLSYTQAATFGDGTASV